MRKPTDVAWWQSRASPVTAAGPPAAASASVPASTWPDVPHVVNWDSFDGSVIPDVAALAGPPFYDLIFMGQDAPNGGTSAASRPGRRDRVIAGNAERLGPGPRAEVLRARSGRSVRERNAPVVACVD